MSSSNRRRIAVVGTGARFGVFVEEIVVEHGDKWEIVGLCDSNPARAAYYQQLLRDKHACGEIPTFSDERFDEMVRTIKPDCVLVTTPDYVHHQYVIAALKRGCNVICEKPLTTEPSHCRQIMQTVRETGRSVRVTHNLRWTPGNTLVAELLRKNTIGKVMHVQMEYLLDLSHGADYFRRWHREKKKSGGLFVHKSSHHFDLVNWWLDDIPQQVFATARLAFYGRDNAARRGVTPRHPRYTVSDSTVDPFALRLDQDELFKSLYLDAEKHDGYLRDQNVFWDGITTEDTINALVKYRGGATFSYSLNAFSPREGYHVTLCGDKGRIEYDESFGHEAENGHNPFPSRCVVHRMFETPCHVAIPTLKGSHLGADQLLGNSLFDPAVKRDPLQREAGIAQGALAALTGMAANISVAEGRAVNPADLCDLGKATRLTELDPEFVLI